MWRAALDRARAYIGPLERMLSVDEWQRAARFRSSHDRERFVITRGFLREVLGAYVQTDPADVQFDTGPKGKPSVRAGAATEPVQFSLSHSDSIALLAITADRPVGIDIAKVSRDPEHDPIVRQFFSAVECQEYFRLDDVEKPRAFARLWTRKEAYLKALGEGLSKPLDSFTVRITPDAYAESAVSAGERSGTGEWMVFGIEVPCGYEAALAAQGQILNVFSWIWQPGAPVCKSSTSSYVPYKYPLPRDDRRDPLANRHIDTANRLPPKRARSIHRQEIAPGED